MTESKNPNIPSKEQIADNLQSKVDSTSRQLKDKGSEQLEQYGSQAASSMESVAEATQAAADALEENNQTMLSNYVSELASGISEFASSLRNKNTDEILQDVTRIARDNAGLFLLGSVAVGFGLARVAKASNPSSRSRDYEGWESYYGVNPSSDLDESLSENRNARGGEHQSSFSETEADALSNKAQSNESRPNQSRPNEARPETQPQTHAGTSYIPEEGSGASTSQQSTAGARIADSQNKPKPGDSAERRL